METLNYIIVETDNTYNNTTELGVIENTTIESVAHINREVTVVASPKGTVLEKGDKIIIHHNILRARNGYHGKVVTSDYFIKDNLYFVPLTEVFMYKKKEEKKWIAMDPYCFVRPIIKKEGVIEDGKDHKGNQKLQGVLTHPNKTLLEYGYREGDKVIFSDYSEYEFKVNKEVVYKMSTKDVLLKID